MSKIEKPGLVGPPASPTPISPAHSEDSGRVAMAEGTIESRRRRQPETIEDRIRVALSDTTLGEDELAAELELPLDEVIQATKELAQAKKIANLGPAHRPHWTWRAGESSPEKLALQVVRLLKERPSSVTMLAHATGARYETVAATLSRLIRKPGYRERIEKVGTIPIGDGDDHEGVWYLHEVAPPTGPTLHIVRGHGGVDDDEP